MATHGDSGGKADGHTLDEPFESAFATLTRSGRARHARSLHAGCPASAAEFLAAPAGQHIARPQFDPGQLGKSPQHLVAV